MDIQTCKELQLYLIINKCKIITNKKLVNLEFLKYQICAHKKMIVKFKTSVVVYIKLIILYY